MSTPTRELFKFRRDFLLRFLVVLVAAHGLFVVATTLLEQTALRPGFHVSNFTIDVPLLLGLGLIYLSSLLRRRKRTAWFVALLVYTFMIGFYAPRINMAFNDVDVRQIFEKLALPLLMLALLWINQAAFTVKSDIRSFGYSVRISLIILAVALLYGTIGFALLDDHDFHHEVGLSEAVHRTVDQFGLTTTHSLEPSSRRAQLFVDSLSVVSIGALGYIVISLFQPIRARYHASHDTVTAARLILEAQPGTSEDFFKLWPQDKSYYFDKQQQAGLAYQVKRGVALVIGDPFGEPRAAKRLLRQFEDECFGNDWLPAYIHTEPDWSAAYERLGYNLQKLGEEAVMDIAHFETELRGNKYFRQIRNKFERLGYTTEYLSPPHDSVTMQRLRVVSDEWLDSPGRSERGLLMGYFDEHYIQQNPLVVARDSDGVIQAFLNQVPSYDPDEATYDMLRHSKQALGNVNDLVLMAFIEHLSGQHIERLNLGLCPLAGLDEVADKSIINTTLRFVYANGDRFYSFSGLRRFKSKYQPTWSERYVAYPGGIANFAKVMNSLNRAMRVKLPKPK